jgi:hypothetical protein
MNKYSLAEITARHDELLLTDREVVKECEAFVDIMTRDAVFPRLAEQCGPYIGRLGNDDRTAVLAIALELAWEFSGEFDPTKQSLVSWWDACLRYAMGARTHWMCRFRQGWVKVATADVPTHYAESTFWN